MLLILLITFLLIIEIYPSSVRKALIATENSNVYLKALIFFNSCEVDQEIEFMKKLNSSIQDIDYKQQQMNESNQSVFKHIEYLESKLNDTYSKTRSMFQIYINKYKL